MKPCSHSATFPRHPAIRFKDDSERSVLLLHCTHFVEFCYSLGFGTTAVSGDSRDSVDFLIVASVQTVVIQFAHALFTVLQSCSRVCPVLYLSSPIQTTLSTLHVCNIITWRDIHDHSGSGASPVGAAFTEKMNAGIEDDELEFTAVDVEPNKQSNDPPPEFTGTKPSEFKSYRKKVKL